ncbi:MAG: serine/threonine protein kinase [Sandaracinaceae bacterium]
MNFDSSNSITPLDEEEELGSGDLDLDSEVIEVQPEATEGSVGRYRLCYEIASGGMATVYLARAQGPGGFEKLVALKCILPHLAKDPRFVDMFFDEARVAARIDHPNVCTVFDFGKADGRHFIAMEYVVGETISTLVRRAAQEKQSLAPSAAARIVADACEGLHAAHELRDRDGKSLGVIHRDISPQNLTVAYDGTVRVMDFGIARAANRRTVTKTGALKGKIAYMAPEQLRREKVDRRADVWAMGVVLFEMLTARRLFKRRSEVETIKAVDEGPIVQPRTLFPHVPEALNAIVLKALERDVEKRYASAREMGMALRAFLAKSGEMVGPPEIGHLMGALFPEERRGRMRLVDEARTVSDASGIRGALAAPAPSPRPPPIPAPPVAATVQPRAPNRMVFVAAGFAVGALLLGVMFAGVLFAAGKFDPTPSTTVVVGSPEPSEPQVIAVSTPPDDTVGANPAEEPQLEPEVEAPELAERAEPDSAEPNSAEPDAEEEGSADTLPAAEDRPAPERAPPAEPRSAPRDPASETRPRHSNATGTVAVVATGGWADIYVGGQPQGRTPRRLVLPVGRQLLELRPFGGTERIRRRVVIRREGTARLSVPLQAP